MNLLIVWLTIAMLAWSPPSSRQASAETQRYAEIARAALDVSFDPTEKPLFEGPHGRAKTALQILAIAGFESSYRKDIQMGSKRGKAGDSCLMQVIIVKARRMRLSTVYGGTYEWSPASAGPEGGLTADDLVGLDVRTCFRVGLHLARESFQICHDLSMYTNGKCNGEIKAKHREMRAHQHYKMHPAPLLDANILSPTQPIQLASGF
jgi:hypothetical protein